MTSCKQLETVVKIVEDEGELCGYSRPGCIHDNDMESFWDAEWMAFLGYYTHDQ